MFFAGIVNDAIGDAESEPKKPFSTARALARIEAIPPEIASLAIYRTPYIQPMVKRNVESFAYEQGYIEIDGHVMDAVVGV